MKQIGSAITTPPREAGSSTGMQPGEHGLGMLESSKALAFLLEHTPEEVARAAVSRASQLGVELRVSYSYLFPRDERGNSMGCVTIAKGCEVSGDMEARKKALEAVHRTMVPAPQREIEAWLAELSVIVPKRAEDEFTESLRIEAYAGRLQGYPADVAKAALLGRTWPFWPSWDELKKHCDMLVSPRRVMIGALARENREESAERERISAERASQVLAEVWGEREVEKEERPPATNYRPTDEQIAAARVGNRLIEEARAAHAADGDEQTEEGK